MSNKPATVQQLANAYTTYLECFGHHKADMNERRVKNYKEELTAMDIPFPSDKELGEIGIYNGEGSY